MKWLIVSGAVALGMVATVVTMAIGPQSTLAAPAPALASCAASPTSIPTVSVDNSDTSQFALGQTITIRGSNYRCNAPLTIAVIVPGGQDMTGTVQVTTDATGAFQTSYMLPTGGSPPSAYSAYPLTIQVYDVYGTPLANLVLRSCSENGTLITAIPVGVVCGPQTLIQDGNNYSLLQPLEQDAEQQIADLRGVNNDTTNIYFSRGEIRADMLLNLISKINTCGQSASTSTCALPGDVATVNYYAGLVKQERVDVAQLADNLYEATGTFCIPGTSSCNWQSWKSLQCAFLVPLGFGALTGSSQSDSNQLAYQNETATKVLCPSGPVAGQAPEQPSFDDFTSWAAAAILSSQIQQWAARLHGVDTSYTSAAALTEVQQEYAAALDSYQEGATYLTVKDGQDLLAGGAAGESSAEKTIGELLKGLSSEFGPDILEEMVTQVLAKVIESLLPDLVGDLGSEALATADTIAPFIIAAVLGAAVGIFIGVTNDQLGCALQSALTAAQSDNLYNDITGNTSYTYSSTSGGICPSGTVQMSKDSGVALLFGALMASTMPDFTNLRDQAANAGPALPSDPVFVHTSPYNAPTSTVQGNFWVENWPGNIAQVSISHGWFVVNGQYQPDLEYRQNVTLFRAWIDGNQFVTYRVAIPLGLARVQSDIDGLCPGVMVGVGFHTTNPGMCVIPPGQTSGALPYQTASFLPHPAINPGYRIAVGPMTGDQSGAPFEQANIRTVTAYTSVDAPTYLSEGIEVDTPILPNNLVYSASYLLSQPAPNCFTTPGITGWDECENEPSLLYQIRDVTCVGDGCPNQTDSVALHYVGAADDNFTADSTGKVAGGVLVNDAPTAQDQTWLATLDISEGNTQVSVVDGVSNGQLNLGASPSSFASNGDFVYTINSGSTVNSGAPFCQQFPIPGTTSQGYKVCGGPTSSTSADSFIYKLCYSVPVVYSDGSGSNPSPAVCTYAQANITGIPQKLTFSPPGPKTYGDPTFSNPATSTGPGEITYTTGTGSVGCSIDSRGMVTITGAAVGSNYCILTASQGGTGAYLPAPSVTIQFHIAQAPLSVTAVHPDLTYGDAVPSTSSYVVTYSGFKLNDTQASVIGGNSPSCGTNYQQGNDTGNYAINCAIGTLSSPNYTFVSGYTGSDGFGGTSGTALSSTAVQVGAFKVTPAVLTVTPPVPPTVQYSDPLPGLAPTVTGFLFGQNASILTTQPTCTPGPVTASFSNAAGTVTTTTGVNAPAGTYTITCSGAVLAPAFASDYTIQYNTSTLAVTQEDAAIDLTGAQSAVPLPSTGSATNQLTATVWDSAANGYSGANAESGATATIGDVTRMFVEFDIYQAGSCLSGTPAFAPVVPVSATSTAGVGTATYSFTQSTPGAFCVVPRVVGATAGSVNGFYTAPGGPVNGIAFYVPNGAFVTGGGWVPDPNSSNGHGNFGFEAHYNGGGKPQGQFVYVWRGTYNGQAANFIIKSNAITSLTIVKLGPTAYQATLQGKCSYSIVSQATGQQLYSEGNDTFIVTVTDGDNGLPQPLASNDHFSLSTFQIGNVKLHPIATIALSKGDVVVHN